MQIYRDVQRTKISFKSSEQALDLFYTLAIQLNSLGEEILLTEDALVNRAKKLLWESGFSLLQALRRELLSTLPEKQISLRI